jgi:serine/threonine-protein kinase
MAPEQVRGQTLDPRSDIFALGCVVYEMLAGAHPFRLETRVDTLSAVLTSDPPRLSELTAGIHPILEWIIDRCLEKAPDDRFESARDVAFALKALKEKGLCGHDSVAGSFSKRFASIFSSDSSAHRRMAAGRSRGGDVE